MKTFLTSILEGLASMMKISRDAFAKELEEISHEIRAGKLLSDEAFNQAKKDADSLQNLYESKR